MCVQPQSAVVVVSGSSALDRSGRGRPGTGLSCDWPDRLAQSSRLPRHGAAPDYLPIELPDWIRARKDYSQPVQILTAQLYLCDIDESVGPTRVVPGSHFAGRSPRRARTAGRGKVPGMCCVTPATRWCFAVTCGMAGVPTIAPQCATCCKCTTAGAWLRRSSLPTWPGTSTLKCWKKRRPAEALIGEHEESVYD